MKDNTGHLHKANAALTAESLQDTPPASASTEETAAYIADVTLQMRNIANRANMKFLAYLLEMSFQEAFDLAQGQCARKR